MKLIALLLLATTSAFAASPSINNDDSCDIKVGPAATLLLPYFEVDVNGTSGRTTLFTVTNVTRYPQIAHVTLWTDRAYPVLMFNLFLTGYDVQAINLADVLLRNTVATTSGTTAPGSLSAGSNANLRLPSGCDHTPGILPAEVMTGVRNALTSGSVTGSPSTTDPCGGVGSPHLNAIGYATVDVVALCTTRSPTDPLYFTNDLLFDNVLIGDYQQLGAQPAGVSTGSYDATGNTMVHIRAMPEGGAPGTNVATGLPYTFYDRYTPASTRTIDRRQPLPSVFAARYIQGGSSALLTNITIWREGVTDGTAGCSVSSNRNLPIAELVRFDEHENSFAYGDGPQCSPITDCLEPKPTLTAASTTNTTFPAFPPLATQDAGGWLYLNLNNGGSSAYSVTASNVPRNTPPSTLAPDGSTTTIGPRPSQNWVTVTLFGHLNERITAEFDAATLGNGCSPSTFISTATTIFPTTGALPIAPAGGVFVCPPGTTLTNGSTQQCTGTNINPPP